MSHECIMRFDTLKIDNCTGKGWNRCYGTNPMMLEVYYQGKDGTECYCDEWIEVKVDYCPFCGLKGDWHI